MFIYSSHLQLLCEIDVVVRNPAALIRELWAVLYDLNFSKYRHRYNWFIGAIEKDWDSDRCYPKCSTRSISLNVKLQHQNWSHALQKHVLKPQYGKSHFIWEEMSKQTEINLIWTPLATAAVYLVEALVLQLLPQSLSDSRQRHHRLVSHRLSDKVPVLLRRGRHPDCRDRVMRSLHRLLTRAHWSKTCCDAALRTKGRSEPSQVIRFTFCLQSWNQTHRSCCFTGQMC